MKSSKINAKRPGKVLTLVDYLIMIRNNLLIFVIILTTVAAGAVAYTLKLTDIYTAQVTLRITKPDDNLLDVPIMSNFGGRAADRFIANEIETMTNITIREQVAKVIVDTFKAIANTDDISLIQNKEYHGTELDSIISSYETIANILEDKIQIKQKKGLDFVEITMDSPSAKEAALIVNTYAKVYGQFNLSDNRKEATRIKDFLEERKNEKYLELKKSENAYKRYQLQGGTIEINEQAKSLIETMTDLESRTQAAEIEMLISKGALIQYKDELKRRDLSVSNYMDSKISEPYILSLQQEIAQLETQRDLVLAGGKTNNNKKLIDEFETKLNNLKTKLKNSIDEYQKSILAATPQEIRSLTQQIFDEEVKYNSLVASHTQLKNFLSEYQRRFDKLPQRTITMARLERERLADEKLYILLEDKYQEAYIREQATLGNVLVLNYSKVPALPSKPNRKKYYLLGLVFAFCGAAGFVIVKELNSKSIKTPEDIEEREIKFLGWIPKIKGLGGNGKSSEFIISDNSNILAVDSFKSLRTTLRYSRVDKESRSLLITSAAPAEGKTFISINLAGSYALVGKKTIIIDCDLRRPRVHSTFNEKLYPGLTDYLVKKVAYEDIIRKSSHGELCYITSGTIPPNPVEILDSKGMKFLMNGLKDFFDMIIVDSPPLSTLSDAPILSRLVDETILVIKSKSTEIKLLERSVEALEKIAASSFSGVVLNNFNLKKSYGSYYYNYTKSYDMAD